MQKRKMPCFGSEHVKISLPVSSFVHSELLSFIFDCSIQAATQLLPSPNKIMKHQSTSTPTLKLKLSSKKRCSIQSYTKQNISK